MSLGHLDQDVLLDRGQAEHVHLAGHAVHLELLARDPTRGHRLSPSEALALKPLGLLLLKLDRLATRDRKPLPPVKRDKRGRPRKRPPAKPHKLRVPFDQLVAVRCFYARMLARSTDPTQQLLLCTALARFHQPSLSLESHVQLPPATGPGAQTRLL